MHLVHIHGIHQQYNKLLKAVYHDWGVPKMSLMLNAKLVEYMQNCHHLDSCFEKLEHNPMEKYEGKNKQNKISVDFKISNLF